jgi:signal transduction histidine kinase
LAVGLVLITLAGLVQSFDRVRRDERAARAEAESAQRQLVRQNEQLRETDRLKDEFVALISHDLRTPLTSIMGYLELVLDDDNLTEEQRGFPTSPIAIRTAFFGSSTICCSSPASKPASSSFGGSSWISRQS